MSSVNIRRAEDGGRSYHHGDLRRALTEAARAMLERDGPESVSFRAIARAVGVSQTAPYNHFRSKEDLLATVAEAGLRELADRQAAAAASAPPGRARLLALGQDYVGFALAHPQLYRLMFGVGVSDWSAHPGARAAKSASFAPLATALAEHLGTAGAASTDDAGVEVAALTAWSVAHGLATLLLDGSVPPEKLADGAEATTARVMEYFVGSLDTR